MTQKTFKLLFSVVFASTIVLFLFRIDYHQLFLKNNIISYIAIICSIFTWSFVLFVKPIKYQKNKFVILNLIALISILYFIVSLGFLVLNPHDRSWYGGIIGGICFFMFSRVAKKELQKKGNQND